MMYVYIFLALLFSVQGGVTKYVEEKEPKCEDENAVYKPVTSYCEPTCDDWNISFPCIDLGMPGGCVCKDGFVLNENNECIKPENCPAGCGRDLNAEFSICPPRPACQLTCDGQRDDCSPGCMEPGCVCKRGFVYNEKYGKCTRSQECTEGCKGDPNSIFSFCTPRCERTCNNPLDLVCTDDCAPPGCMCKLGFFLDEKIGKCVERWDCPEIECEDENAEYKRCPTRCERPTCYSQDSNWCYGNPEPCESPSCRCKQGFVFNELSGKCIEPDNCPVTGCGGDLNAEFRWCTPPRDCDRTCNDDGPTDYICLPVCTNPRCVCRTGFVLNENGNCVEPWNCPA